MKDKATLIILTALWFLSSTKPLLAEITVEPIQLGAALAVTGAVAQWGDAELKGATLAIEELNKDGGINGRNLKLVLEDTQGDNAKTVSSVKKLIDISGIKFIIGPSWLDSLQGVVPVIERAQVLAITPSASMSILNPHQDKKFVFSLYPNSDSQFSALLQAIKADGHRRIALILDEDPWWMSLRDMVLRDARKLGLEVVIEDKIPLGTTDFRAWISKARRYKLDAVIVGFSSEAPVLSYFRQKSELKYLVPSYSTDTVCDFRQSPNSGNLLDGTRCIYPTDVPSSDFRKAFEQRFQLSPVLTAGKAYDAVMVLAKALKAGHQTPLEVRNFLKTNPLETVSYGTIKFDEFQGISNSSFAMRLVKGKDLQ